MKKDKEWLESAIIKELMTNSGNPDMTTYEQGRVSALKYYLKLIDQLDEPEITEEQAWKTIAKSTNRPVMFWENMRDNYLSSLKEPELPAIPRFVADYLDDFKKQNLTLGDALDTHLEDDKQIHTWLYEDGEVRNDEVFARAWLDGYKIEKEKMYHVLDQNRKVMIRKYRGVVERVNATMSPSDYPHWQKEKLELTEQEIKDYDERYWAFAEEVPNE